MTSSLVLACLLALAVGVRFECVGDGTCAVYQEPDSISSLPLSEAAQAAAAGTLASANAWHFGVENILAALGDGRRVILVFRSPVNNTDMMDAIHKILLAPAGPGGSKICTSAFAPR